MKKFLVILMVLAMASVLFVGCTTPPVPDPDPDPDPVVPVVTAAETVAAVKDAALVLDLAVLTEAGDIVAFLDALADTNFTGYLAANDNAYVAAAIVGSFSAVTTVALVNTAVTAVNTAVTAAATTVAANIAAVAADKADVAIAYAAGETAAAVKTALTFVAPATNLSTITWSAAANSAVSNTGAVTRPIYSAGNTVGNIVATITKGAATDTVTFNVTVLKKDFTVAAGVAPLLTFTITPDGYVLLTDFAAANSTFAANSLAALNVNGVISTITYVAATGVGTVAITGTAAITAAASTRIINVIKDGKTVTKTLSIPAVTAGDTSGAIALSCAVL